MTAKVSYNDRLEVRFDAVPDSATRGELKRRGFWWDGRAGCWWLARPVSLRFVRQEPISQDGFEYALRGLQDYCGLTAEQASALRKLHSDACDTAGIRGMEEACGIA